MEPHESKYLKKAIPANRSKSFQNFVNFNSINFYETLWNSTIAIYSLSYSLMPCNRAESGQLLLSYDISSILTTFFFMVKARVLVSPLSQFSSKRQSKGYARLNTHTHQHRVEPCAGRDSAGPAGLLLWYSCRSGIQSHQVWVLRDSRTRLAAGAGVPRDWTRLLGPAWILHKKTNFEISNFFLLNTAEVSYIHSSEMVMHY